MAKSDEVQFRYKLYNDIKFPYLQSLVSRHFTIFWNEEVGFIGVLHLKWFNEDNNIVYDNPKNGSYSKEYEAYCIIQLKWDIK